jgi:Alpha/beta hydrolase
MVDLASLRSAQPGLLTQAASDWQAIGSRLDGQAAALHSDVMEPLFGAGNWIGTAANAANANLGNLAGQLSVSREYASVMSSLLQDAASGVADAQAWLRAAENLAAQNKLTIGADGSVSADPGPPLLSGTGTTSLVDALSAAMREVADLVSQALTVADKVDAQITVRLEAVQKFAAKDAASELRDAGRLAGSLDRDALPPSDASPAEVNEWWNALNAEEQKRLIGEFPSQIGWMNGLPAWARNDANTLAMDDEERALQKEKAYLEAHVPPEYLGANRWGPELNPAWTTWQGELSSVQNKLAEISSVQSGITYAESKAGAHNVFLLGFNTDGNGHAIVAVGNPDTAVNTVTYVPGVGSTLHDANGDIGRATALWGLASSLDPGKAVSSIYWLGYNAPQLGLSQGLGNFAMASTGDAVSGGRALAGFESGLLAAHQAGVPDHTVVLGHSYGTLVTGEAAVHDGLHPDDIIFVGSPGVGVNSAAQLGISPAHVWAGANSHDPVPDLPPLNPITALSNDNASYFGTNPATSAFGGEVFNANITPGHTFSGLTFSAHSSYWDPNSSSLISMAHIVDGEYGGVILDHLPPPAPPGSVTNPGPIVGPGII